MPSGLTGGAAYESAKATFADIHTALTAAVTQPSAITDPLTTFDKSTGGTVEIICEEGLSPSYGSFGCGR